MTFGLSHPWRRVKTASHFPVSAIAWRLYLRIARLVYRLPRPLEDLPRQWNEQMPDGVAPASDFSAWRPDQDPALRRELESQTVCLLEDGQGEILNEPFALCRRSEELRLLLGEKTPLWRENYGYLEFLHPLIIQAQVPEADPGPMLACLESQFNLFWNLSPKERLWSTYGVSRRLLTYCRLLPLLGQCSPCFQDRFWQNFYRESCYLARFLEWDIRGNHLIKNLKAWLAVTLVLERLPATRRLAGRWWKKLSGLLPQIFQAQVLADGFHMERTPMYHHWVLQDLLDCLNWLRQEKPDYSTQALIDLAGRMIGAAEKISHVSGRIPLLGDSAWPQTPPLGELKTYAAQVLGAGTFLPDVQPGKASLLEHLPQVGLAAFRHKNPASSLVMDCGDFGPRILPAHAHGDLASFELHIEHQPVIVDSGVSDYEPSLLRDYFRGTAAHNTVWVPGEEQAELWGSFRVAAYPDFQGCEVEQDVSGAKVTVSYENYSAHYHHQRSIYSVSGRFWVVQDWMRHLHPPDRACYSLLHVHPDCRIAYEQEVFSVGENLLVVPYGMSKIEWSAQSPWRNNLNLFSPGFSLARPGQLIAVTPKATDCFGWVLVPYQGERPVCLKQGEGLEVRFADIHFLLTWESEGLRVAARAPMS